MLIISSACSCHGDRAPEVILTLDCLFHPNSSPIHSIPLLLGGSTTSPKLPSHPGGSGGYGKRGGGAIRCHWRSWKGLLVQLEKV